MSNKYRVVNVYTGYAENSIQYVETRETDLDLNGVAQLVESDVQTAVRVGRPFSQVFNDVCDDDEGILTRYISEFFTGVTVSDDVAFVNAGEENVVVVIPETSVWFDRVTDETSVYDHHMDAWSELLDSQFILS